jgi:hypothetical protein
MGWVNEDAPEHEGYVVGLVEEEERVGGYVRLRELAYPKDDCQLSRVRFFQSACECGWRSRRFFAPVKAEWSPFTLELHDADIEEDARQLWRRHCEAERPGYGRLMPCKGVG